MITGTLHRIPLFAGLSEEQLEYVQQGNEIRLRSGEYVKRTGDPPDGLYIVIEGEIEWTSTVGQQDVYVMTLASGEFWGHELILTDMPYPVSGRALNEARLYKLQTDAFWRMLSGCPSILRRLVALLVERWGSLGTVEQQHVRLASLGQMAAGLAHALNNPAAASRQMIGGLRESLEDTVTVLSHKLVQQHVFEPFFTTKGVGEGTGLGLDIARRIVAGNHKGDIRLLSKPGDTRFQVRLPM